MKDQFAYVRDERRQDGATTYCVQTLTCVVCNTKFETRKSKMRKPADQIANMATRAGWVADLKKGQHLCPKHNPQHKDETMPAAVKDTPTISTQTRRAIFRAIDDSYDEKKQQYVTGVSDKSIALEVKTTWGWVARIREENFGPAGPDPALVAFAKQVDQMAGQVRDLEAKAMRTAEEAEAMGKVLAEMKKKMGELT